MAIPFLSGLQIATGSHDEIVFTGTGGAKILAPVEMYLDSGAGIYLMDDNGVNLTLSGSNATFEGQIVTTQNQITTNIGTTSAIRLEPGSTTNTTGKSSIFLGTSPVDNYGISLRGARLGTDGTPTFELATHYGSANGTVALSIDNSQNATFEGNISLANGWTLQNLSGGYAKFSNWVNVSDTGLYTTEDMYFDLDDSTSRFVVRGVGNSELFEIDTSDGNSATFAGKIKPLQGMESAYGVYTDGGTYSNQWQKVLSIPYASNMFGYGGIVLSIMHIGQTSGQGAHADIHIHYKFQSNNGRLNANIINYGETEIDADHIAIRRDHSNLRIELYHKVTTSYTSPRYLLKHNTTTITWYNTVTGNDTALAATTDNGFTELNITNGFTSNPANGNASFAGSITATGGVINTNTGANPFYITRLGNTNEALSIKVLDDNVRFESIQDETSDNYGGFDFRMDGGTTEPDFVIRKNAGTPLFTVRGDGAATFAGDVDFDGHITLTGSSKNIVLNYGNEIRTKDSGGTERTVLRAANNKLQYGWSYAGEVEFMGGGSYTPKITINTDGSTTFAGNIMPSTDGGATLGVGSPTNLRWGGIELSNGAGIQWTNGDARIIEGLVNNYSLSFQTYDSSTTTLSTALRLDGNNLATFAGDVQVDGNLIVTGNTTSVNVEDLNVEQGEITLNYAASSDTSSSAGGSGIRIQDAVDASNDATMLWNATDDRFVFSHAVVSPGLRSTASNTYTGGMSTFETTLTNNDDWQNSPISILERDNIGTASADDKYSPNLNFHWGGKVSRSLWMDAVGDLHYGEYSSAGVPGVNGKLFIHSLDVSNHATIDKDIQHGSFGNNNAEFAFGQTVANKVFNYGAEFQVQNASIQIVMGRNDGTNVNGTGGIGADQNNAFHVYDTTSIAQLFQVAQTSGNTTIGANGGGSLTCGRIVATAASTGIHQLVNASVNADVLHLTTTGDNPDLTLKFQTDHIYNTGAALHIQNDGQNIYLRGAQTTVGTTTPVSGYELTVSNGPGKSISAAGEIYAPTVEIGSALLFSASTTSATTTTTVSSVAKATYNVAFFDYSIKNGTNVRAGTVVAAHDGTNVEFNETSTVDLGDTSDVTLSVDISGNDMRLRATTTSSTWTIKSFIRSL